MAPLAPCPAVIPVSWHLSVGVGIGILGFLGVVVPLVRDKIGRWEKAVWVAVMALLLCLELRSIRLDQDQHDREQAFAACEQLNQFQKIADTLQSAIAASQAQFQSTMAGINTTLGTANRTLIQTQPRASIETGTPAIDGMRPNRPDVPFRFIMPYTNSGEMARNLHIFGRIYVSDPDQKIAEKDVMAKFNADWKEHLRKFAPVRILAKGTNPTMGINENPGFTLSEIERLGRHEASLYEMYRMLYTDQAGTWQQDQCLLLGPSLGPPVTQGRTLGETIPCAFGNSPPHPAKQPPPGSYAPIRVPQ